GTHKAGGVTLLGPANGVAAVAAGVEQNLDAALAVADDDDAVLTDVGGEEVARLLDLALVAHEVPGASEDPLELQLVDVLVGKDAPIDRAFLDVDHAEELIRPCQLEGHPASPCRIVPATAGLRPLLPKNAGL